MVVFTKLLVANRGEIALRVFRAAAALDIKSVGVYTTDDADAMLTGRCDEAVALPGAGPAAYLDIAAIVQAAQDVGADCVHPGYGFLSENADFARACADAGIVFIGPDVDALEIFGDKGRARALADAHGVPTLPGTLGRTTRPEMEEFLDALGADFTEGRVGVVIKAVAGGGGRGMRVVRRRDALAETFERCQSEALAAFGVADLYIEQLLNDARHIEVQVLGDGSGEVVQLWDRDCSVQRRHQKLIEIAPSRDLDPQMRVQMLAAATRLLSSVNYRGLATVEFLVSAGGDFFFMETNPRLQVEHTVTEEILNLDLVQTQIRILAGSNLAELGLTQDQIPRPEGYAIQIRINAETMQEDGRTIPQAGSITRFDLPSGRGIRVDSCGYVGYQMNPRFDSLLAKIIVHDRSDDFEAVRRLAYRALCETHVGGVLTNISLQQAIIASDDFIADRCRTDYVDTHVDHLLAAAGDHKQLSFTGTPAPGAARRTTGPTDAAPEGASVLAAPMSATVISVEVAPGDIVADGQTLIVLEAMKMQHVVQAECSGQIVRILVREGEIVDAGDPVAYLVEADAQGPIEVVREDIDPAYIRPDLANLLHRKGLLLDAQRPRVVAKRHGKGMRMARENVGDLVDQGTFVEYGGLAIAAQRKRRSLEDLIQNTPADGMVTGVGTINGSLFGRERAMCAVLAYDYTVLAGTQGYFNHKKTDRILEVARQHSYPVVLFAEGGGGRPGDIDPPKVAGIHIRSFTALGELSGKVPTVGIASGRCFAGNATLLGTCDVVIATSNANIGMGGPAMIEGGGLGVYAPEEIGPIDVQTRNGVVDIEVVDEAEAVVLAKKYLSYFQGDLADFQEHDQRRLRHVIPENRMRVYDVRKVIDIVCDVDSVLELRQKFGTCVITALVRLGGRPMGLLANNPAVLGGAIDSDGADKAARFLQLCDVFGLPVVSLCDTPGFMVGPESEKTATVRHFSRLFVRGANMTVPLATVVLRKSYGLGAMGMAAGSMSKPTLTVAWPSGEFGGMGLEGAVRLGYRKELDAIDDPEAREKRYQELVSFMYEWGGGINTAMHLEIDDVIDPAETRSLLMTSLPDVAKDGWTNPRVRTCVDTW